MVAISETQKFGIVACVILISVSIVCFLWAGGCFTRTQEEARSRAEKEQERPHTNFVSTVQTGDREIDRIVGTDSGDVVLVSSSKSAPEEIFILVQGRAAKKFTLPFLSRSVSISPDGKFTACHSASTFVIFHGVFNGEPFAPVDTIGGDIVRVCFDSSSSRVLVELTDSSVSQYTIDTDRVRLQSVLNCANVHIRQPELICGDTCDAYDMGTLTLVRDVDSRQKGLVVAVSRSGLVMYRYAPTSPFIERLVRDRGAGKFVHQHNIRLSNVDNITYLQMVGDDILCAAVSRNRILVYHQVGSSLILMNTLPEMSSFHVTSDGHLIGTSSTEVGALHKWKIA